MELVQIHKEIMQYNRSIISLFYELILFFFAPASETRKFESQLLASKVSLGGSDFLSDQFVSYLKVISSITI